VREVNYLLDPESWPTDVYIQTNYRERPRPAEVSHEAGGRATVRFERQGKPATPGQIGAFYSGSGRVLAGSVIET
jgi:tRNA-specific 2-thiouridylase